MKKNWTTGIIEMGKTLMKSTKGSCFLCGWAGVATHEHHIFFGTANRKKSEKYGMKVYLCPSCHIFSPVAVHKCRETDLKRKREGQRVFEEKIGSRDEFIREFGRSYL